MSFGKLISVDQTAREHFHVPKYQREYTWRREQWERLLNDIDENDPGYFMGSIISVNPREVGHGAEMIFELVDGQQRLTTLSLLLAAAHAKLKAAVEVYEPADERDMEDARSCLNYLRGRLVKRKKDAGAGDVGAFSLGKSVYFLRVQPSAQNNNVADYRYLLADAGLFDAQGESQRKPPYFGNRLLGRAYAYFREQIPADIAGLRELIERIGDLMFVHIAVDSQADAFTLFESLNNRGVPLSAMDIIKNKMLAQLEKRRDADIDASFERWQKLIEAIPQADDQERYLRHFYNANKHRKEIRVDGVSRASRSLIIRIYEALINRDSRMLFDELMKGAEIYGKLLRPETGPVAFAGGLEELARISSAPAYLLLLYLFSLDGKHFEDEGFLGRVGELLVRYFIRRNVTDKPPTRQIDQALIELVESCANQINSGNRLGFEWFVQELMKYAPPASVDEFKAVLRGPIYNTNSWMARYALIQIDRLRHSREYQPDFWTRDGRDRLVWTVEHVLPQTERLHEEWVKMLAGGDRSKARELQVAYVHRLGNLTLSAYNADLATAPFERKQEMAQARNSNGQQIRIGYKNGLVLNSLDFDIAGEAFSLATAPRWDVAMIEARTTRMVDLFANSNLLPGEVSEAKP